MSDDERGRQWVVDDGLFRQPNVPESPPQRNSWEMPDMEAMDAIVAELDRIEVDGGELSEEMRHTIADIVAKYALCLEPKRDNE